MGTDPGGPGDDPGPGPYTGGGNESSEEPPESSSDMSYDEYRELMDELEDINDDQREGGDSSTPTVTPAPGTNVDDPGAEDIDTPTPTQEPVHIIIPETGETEPISEDPGDEWGGPPD